MPPDTATNEPGARHDGWNTLSRFLPYLWPRDNPALRWRIVVASLLILASTGVQLSLPYLLKWAVDAMNVTGPRVAAFVMLTVLGYSAGRFLGTGFDNLRNIVFERVGQDATRALAENVFSRLHKLSLRFHLGRRTGEVTKVIERGTKSIDTMLYFMLFNIAPTVLQLVIVAVIFYLNFGWGLVAATALAVVTYIYVTRTITEWVASPGRGGRRSLRTSPMITAPSPKLSCERWSSPICTRSANPKAALSHSTAARTSG